MHLKSERPSLPATLSETVRIDQDPDSRPLHLLVQDDPIANHRNKRSAFTRRWHMFISE